MMSLEWLYSNLLSIVIVLAIAMVVLFLFPVILGIDLLNKSKDKK
tara:strand:- start:744 stop:878 length:135 start_codon:yes stop_codon:yes gene_type:complete